MYRAGSYQFFLIVNRRFGFAHYVGVNGNHTSDKSRALLFASLSHALSKCGRFDTVEAIDTRS